MPRIGALACMRARAVQVVGVMVPRSRSAALRDLRVVDGERRPGGWLEHLARLGLLCIHLDAQRRILLSSPTALTIDLALAAEHQQEHQQEHEEGQQQEGGQQIAARPGCASLTVIRAAEQRRMASEADLESRRRTRLVVDEDGTRRWSPDDGCRRTPLVGNGEAVARLPTHTWCNKNCPGLLWMQ